MKIEDVEKGMQVEYQHEESAHFEKGEILTVKEIKEPGYSFLYPDKYCLKFEGYNNCYTYPDRVEPVNKFEVGDPVIYQTRSEKYEAIIFGIAEQKDKHRGRYAISFVNKFDEKINRIISENKLLPRKKRHELQKGDKFIDYQDEKEGEIVVLAKEYDSIRSEFRYFGKIEEYGIVDVWSESDIKEIVYN